MNSSIRTLPADVVHLIAAGEVIDSLAAAIRELAENALDSGATRIAISLYPDLWRVRVADNGAGMDLTDLQKCALSHSTSKIHERHDLGKILTLGFRGEALHSLAHLAHLEIFSRPQNSQAANGWRAVYDAQGKPKQVEAAAVAPGTIVNVRDIFANMPGRRECISRKQQLKAVQATIHHLALCHPQIFWQASKDERRWFTIHAGNTPQQILPQILSRLRPDDLQYVKRDVEAQATPDDAAKQQIEVLAGLPDRCHRRYADWVKIAINGRLVRSPELEPTVIAAFSRTLPRDRYPICFLHLHVTPEQIDWNRHPAKSEIYLENLEFWQHQISQTIEEALQFHSSEGQSQAKVTQLLKASEAKGNYLTDSLSNQGTSQSSPTLPLKAVAQINNTYIVAEHPNGLWLIEQHIAHERILYEQLCDRWEMVAVEPPIILQDLRDAQVEQLQQIGVDIEPFGEKLWAVRSLPAALQERSDREDALIELSSGKSLQAAQVAVACRTAIRNGTPLELPQMQDILDRWQRTRHPRTCPHGRPIYLSLEESDLARFFRRHWVIGKSHGI